MNSSIARQLTDLREKIALQSDRIDELERGQATHEREFSKIHYRLVVRFRKIRAAIMRLEVGESGEKWHVGPAYTQGSRLRIPEKPQRLREMQAAPGYGFEGPKYKAKDELADEELLDDRRNGIPRTV